MYTNTDTRCWLLWRVNIWNARNCGVVVTSRSRESAWPKKNTQYLLLFLFIGRCPVLICISGFSAPSPSPLFAAPDCIPRIYPFPFLLKFIRFPQFLIWKLLILGLVEVKKVLLRKLTAFSQCNPFFPRIFFSFKEENLLIWRFLPFSKYLNMLVENLLFLFFHGVSSIRHHFFLHTSLSPLPSRRSSIFFHIFLLICPVIGDCLFFLHPIIMHPAELLTRIPKFLKATHTHRRTPTKKILHLGKQFFHFSSFVLFSRSLFSKVKIRSVDSFFSANSTQGLSIIWIFCSFH